MESKTLEELMKLSPTEREELVTPERDDYSDDHDYTDEYIDAGDGPVRRLACETPEFFAELDRRSAEHAADPSSAIPWEEVRRKLRALVEE